METVSKMGRIFFTIAVVTSSLFGQSVNSSDQSISATDLAARAERQANLRTCLDGRYSALCNHRLLAGSEIERVRQAEAQANLRTCLDGRYSALCNHQLLAESETERVRQAEGQANLRTCMDGRYSALCNRSLLNASETKAVSDAERRENLKICLDGRYAALCNHSLLGESERTDASTENTRPVLSPPLRSPGESPTVKSVVGTEAPVAVTTRPEGSRVECEENGSCFGDVSPLTGRPKTVEVHGYYRKDGTYVRGHYRSPPRR
jgi:hypothetical protein